MNDVICDECGEWTRVVRISDSFSYGGTHCTYGVGGTEDVSYLGTECCECDWHDEEAEEDIFLDNALKLTFSDDEVIAAWNASNKTSKDALRILQLR